MYATAEACLRNQESESLSCDLPSSGEGPVISPWYMIESRRNILADKGKAEYCGRGAVMLIGGHRTEKMARRFDTISPW